MSKCILIGATGFLGRDLLSELIKQEEEIHVVEHKEKINTSDHYKIIKGGISALSTELINKLKPDLVFHCARPVMPGLRWAGRKIAAQWAARLNRSLIRSMQRCDLYPKLIFASGSLMYGNNPYPRDEESVLDPISFARQYAKGEKPLLETCNDKKFPVQILRFPWLLGKGSWFGWFYLDSIRKHQAIPLFGDGQNKMHFLDVKDAAALMYRYAKQAKTPGLYNVYSDQLLTQAAFVEKVSKVFGVESKDHKQIFSHGIEKEALEAFHSNIELSSVYTEILESFKYRSVEENLKRIRDDSK